MFSRRTQLYVVSDDPLVVDSVSRAAAKNFMRYSVEACPRLTPATILAQPVKPNVILLDARRDLAPAVRFVKRLREQNETRIIPVIYLVNRADDALLEALQCHSTDFLLFPQEATALAARITAVLRYRDSLRRMEQQNKVLTRMAAYDDLTGLYNRRYLLKSLENDIANQSRVQGGIGVFLIDLDNFKEVNDTCGHLAGDRVLLEFARLLTSCLRTIDVVGRIGGDEFCIIKPESSAGLCTAMAQRVLHCISEQRFGPGPDCNLQVTVSIGVAFAPPGTIQSLAGLMGEADKALYQAKQEGRNTFVQRTLGAELVCSPNNSIH